MFSVHIRMTARPGHRDELVERLTDLDIAMDQPEGLLLLGVSKAIDDPDAVLVTHVWTDRAAHDTTTALEQVQAVSALVRELLAEPPAHDYAEVELLRSYV